MARPALLPCLLPLLLLAACAPVRTASDETAPLRRVTEREFAVGELGGTLAMPRGRGPFPALVLVHGSGPADRDNRIGPNTPFRDLAQDLAARGVLVLRYDKRSWLRGATLPRDATANEATVDDAVTAVRLLRQLPEVDRGRVFVAGHSLGGFLAPRIIEREPAVAGLVLLAPLSRPLFEALPGQMRYLAGRDGVLSELERVSLADAERQRDELRAMLAGGPEPPAPMLGIPAAYWRDLAATDPIARLRAAGTPVLVLQGGRDYQVTPEHDLRRWRAGLAGHPDARFITYPALNHYLLPGTGAPDPSEYRRPARVDPRVAADIAAWIGQH